MPSEPSERELQAFCFTVLQRQPPARRVDLLSVASQPWAAALRQLQRVAAAAAHRGIFFSVDEASGARASGLRSKTRPEGSRLPQLATTFVHPSMGSAGLVDRWPDSAGEAAQRAAEARLLSTIRLSDGVVVLTEESVSSDAALRATWQALLLLSHSRFASAPSKWSIGPAAAAAAALPLARWFEKAGWFSLGAWVASRLDVALTRCRPPGRRSATPPPLLRHSSP